MRVMTKVTIDDIDKALASGRRSFESTMSRRTRAALHAAVVDAHRIATGRTGLATAVIGDRP
jgi:hypothetical protein